KQIGRALELDEAFLRNPNLMSEADLRRAVPEWIFGAMEVSADWLRSLQTEPKLWLRVRTETRLAGTLAVPNTLAGSVVYRGEEDLFRTPEFHAGQFEIQDISSQAVGVVCDPQAGETWWDACAGEGGKMLHLAELRGGKGLI